MTKIRHTKEIKISNGKNAQEIKIFKQQMKIKK